MSEPDKSREKSLYHLLLTVVRKLNAPVRSQKTEISNQLKTLTVVKDDGKFKVSIEDGQIVKQVEILVSDVKFYDTKNDPNVAKKNLQKAHEIALELFPALAFDRKHTKNNAQIEKIDLIFIVYALGIVLLSFSHDKTVTALLVAISAAFIPFWNLASNLHAFSRWLGSLTFLVTFVIASHKDSGQNSLAESLIGITLAGYILTYREVKSQKRWPGILMAFPLVSLLYNAYYTILIITVASLVLEIILRKIFRRSKLLGFYVFSTLFSALFFYFLFEVFQTKYAGIIMISQVLTFFPLFYSYLVGVSSSGSIRLVIPIFATLCISPPKSLIYLVIGMLLFFIFRRISSTIDRNSYAKHA